MYENDYIIMFDENGQPYLAHAFGDRWKGFTSRAANSKIGTAIGNARNNLNARWQGSTAHKYVAKIENAFKDGSPRYFYSLDELKAFQREKQAENKLNKAKKKGTAGVKEYQEFYQAKQNADNARSRVKGNRQAAATAIKQYGSTKLSDIRAKASSTAKWIDEHDAGISEAVQLATKGKKLSDEERAALNSERLADQYRTKSNLKYLKRKVGDKVNNAAKWIDGHDAGISETAEYMLKRNKVEGDERDRLHDEMTNTKFGRLVSNTANNARTVSTKVKNSVNEARKWMDEHDAGISEAIELAVRKNNLNDEERAALQAELTADRQRTREDFVTKPVNKAKQLGAKAVDAAGNVKLYYPAQFHSLTVKDIVNMTGNSISNAQAKAVKELATQIEQVQTWFDNSTGEVKEQWGNTLGNLTDTWNKTMDSLKINKKEEEV